MDEVSVMEVMVVVIRIAEIGVGVPRGVCCSRHDASPLGFINQRELLFVGDEAVKCGFEFCETGGSDTDVSGEVVHGVDGGGEFAQGFAAEVHGVEVCLRVDVLCEVAFAGFEDGGFGGGGEVVG